MSAKKKSAAKSATKPTGKAFAKGHDPRRGKGPKKGAPNAGAPPSEVKKAFLAGVAAALPELIRLSQSAANDGDRIRAIDVLGKYAGLTSIEVEVTRPTEMVFRTIT